MARKYNTRCWLCNSTDLEPDSRGIRCRSCGATYNILPKPGSLPITQDFLSNPAGFTMTKVPFSRPSATTKRRAAKARDKK